MSATNASTVEPAAPNRRGRLIASLLIAAHLAAVIAPPLAFQCRGVRGLSPSVASIMNTLAVYSQMLYLDRGYAFFAPDPGPSHLFEVTVDVGSNAGSDATANPNRKAQRVPNLDDQWPRLLYHRHFMLAEFLHDAYQPALPPEAATLVGPDLSASELQAWRLGRQRYETILTSMLEHVQAENGGQPVRIERIEHVIPDFVGFSTAGTPLNHPPSYILLEDIPITLDTLLDTRPQALPQPDLPPTAPTVTEPVPVPDGEKVKQENGQAGETQNESNENRTDEANGNGTGKASEQTTGNAATNATNEVAS
ncbi:hypothetical protein [Neorhodopirellula lusitana]|uniref:hypothetical protein n=1 Tax=Neorhodopirellula lusitana TaxID=445327 RepID=UPI00384E1A3F